MKLRELAPQKIHTVGFEKGERTKFGLASNKKAVKILSSTIYKYKIRAIIREISCNAIDGHIIAGNMNPFDVQLPTVLDPRFIVRDYGTGLSDYMVNEVFTVYFESTKNDSNDLIGAMGLGSKSPFCYTDTFTIESIQDGVKRAYTAYMDDGEPYIDPIYEIETDEPNGVQITVPVKAEDIKEWETEAKRVYEPFTKIRPNFVGVQLNINWMPKPDEADERGIIKHKSSYYKGVYARMGDICYPIDVNMFEGSLFNCYLNSQLSYIIDFPIGTLDFMPSREELSLDKITKKMVQDRLDELSSFYYTDLVNKVGGFETTRDKLIWFENQPSLLRDWISRDRNFDVNGVSISDLLGSLKLNELHTSLRINGYWANPYSSSDCVYQKTGSGSRYDSYKPEANKRQNITRLLYPWEQKKLYVIDVEGKQSRPYIIGYLLKHNLNRLNYVSVHDRDLIKLIQIGYYSGSEIVYLKTSEMDEEKELYLADRRRYIESTKKEKEKRPKTPTAYKITIDELGNPFTEPLFLTKAEFAELPPAYAVRLYGVDEYSRLDGDYNKQNLNRLMSYISTAMPLLGIDVVYTVRNSLWSKIPDSKMRCLDDYMASRFVSVMKEMKPNWYPAWITDNHHREISALKNTFGVTLDRMVKNKYDARYEIAEFSNRYAIEVGGEVRDPELRIACKKHNEFTELMRARVDAAYPVFAERNPLIDKLLNNSNYGTIISLWNTGDTVKQDIVKLIRWK